MLTTTERTNTVSPTPPSQPRLSLTATRVGQAVLDGGWWPRSWDPVDELPGLVLALADRYGRIWQVMLNSTAWDSRFRRLAAGTEMVRMGWFATLDSALLIATTERGEQIDLLVVPPGTAAAAAKRAMSIAADPTNVMRAPAILAAVLPRHPGAGTGPDPSAVWDNEGGRLVNVRTGRPGSRGVELTRSGQSPQ
jgi:hypothetical protein